MPTMPSPAQSAASRQNGTRSAGPATAAGKARSALNGVRHGLCGRTFFLLPDEDPAEFQAHEAMWLAEWRPRDLHEHAGRRAAIRAMWREIRADRLEAQVLTDLFAAGESRTRPSGRPPRPPPSRRWARSCATAAGSSASIEPPWQALESLRQRRPARSAARPSEPDAPCPRPPASGSTPVAAAPSPPCPPCPRPPAAPWSEPEPAPALNRHQRRALAAMSRPAA